MLARALLSKAILASALFLLASSSRSDEVRHHTLDQAVEIGVKSNLDLLAAKYSIPEAEADEVTAGLWNNPSILADTIFEPFGSNWNQTSAGGPRQFDLGVSYPFDLSGKKSAARNSAHEALRATEGTFQDAVRQKIRDIRLAYFDLLVADQQQALSHEKEESLKRLVDTLERRIGKQQLLPLLELRAQLARDQAELDTEAREITLRAARKNLAVLLGYPEVTTIVPDSKLRDFGLSELPPVDQLVSRALEQRPDLLALKITLGKAGLDKRLAHAQVWDDVTVTASVSSQGPISANPADPGGAEIPNAISWDASITVPLPVFNRNQGGIEKAGLIEAQTEKQIDSLKLSITQEVSALYDQLVLGRHLVAAYESKQLNQARKVRDAQSRLFGTGGSVLLDYFDAINAYVGTYSSYYDSVGDYRRNLARLNASLGKDL